jgi:ParB-like chromosome segregation protein Spo0J
MKDVSRPIKHEERIIATSEIDTGDDTCCLGLRTDTDALVASIRDIGLINPPVLRQRKDLKYQIVCGFRRVEACRVLRSNEIKARVLKGDLSELDVLKIAILDNRSHRQLSVVEQAQGIQKLSSLLPPRGRLESLSSLLGFPQNQKVFEKLKALSELPAAIQAGVLDEIVSFEAAVDLSKFSYGDALPFFELFKVLKLSQNKQKEVITFAAEIAIREEIQPREVLQSKEIRTILDRSELNRNEKGSKVRAFLKRRRFPALAKEEERFAKALKALKLDEHIHITAAPYFEGGSVTLRMTFKDEQDFDKRRKTLDKIARNPALKRLLKPLD